MARPSKSYATQLIGRSEGVELTFELANPIAKQATSFDVYTTRPDTMGVTYVGLAAQHLSLAAAKNNPELAAFIEECKNTKVA